MRAYQRIFWGDEGESTKDLKDITKREILILLPLLFLVVGLGVYPSPLIDMIEPAVQNVIDIVQAVL